MLTEKEVEVLNKIKGNKNECVIMINNNEEDLAKSVSLSIPELLNVLDSLVKKQKLKIEGRPVSQDKGRDSKGRIILEDGIIVDVYKVI